MKISEYIIAVVILVSVILIFRHYIKVIIDAARENFVGRVNQDTFFLDKSDSKYLKSIGLRKRQLNYDQYYQRDNFTVYFSNKAIEINDYEQVDGFRIQFSLVRNSQIIYRIHIDNVGHNESYVFTYNHFGFKVSNDECNNQLVRDAILRFASLTESILNYNFTSQLVNDALVYTPQSVDSPFDNTLYDQPILNQGDLAFHVDEDEYIVNRIDQDSRYFELETLTSNPSEATNEYDGIINERITYSCTYTDDKIDEILTELYSDNVRTQVIEMITKMSHAQQKFISEYKANN